MYGIMRGKGVRTVPETSNDKGSHVRREQLKERAWRAEQEVRGHHGDFTAKLREHGRRDKSSNGSADERNGDHQVEVSGLNSPLLACIELRG